ncbi:putative ribonuclease H-like domain-containing protein [Tanacetum coccineum]
MSVLFPTQGLIYSSFNFNLGDPHSAVFKQIQVYVDDIIFGSTKKSWCDEFEALMQSRFQMSSMGELTFFLGLQVKQKEDGIFISQDKYVEISEEVYFVSVKNSLVQTIKPQALLDIYVYDSDYAGENNDRKSIQEVVNFLGRRPYFLAMQKAGQLLGCEECYIEAKIGRKEILKSKLEAKGVCTDDRTEARSATPITSTTTPTMFRDDETIAQVLLNMSQAKAVSREKEKGVELKDVEETERPRPT